MPHKDKDVRNAYWKEYQRTHREQIRANKHRYYMENRSILLEKTRLYQANNPDRRRQWNYDYDLLLKTDVLIHYGNGKCACVKCDFDDMRALSIDHIKGGGNKHRKEGHIPSGNKFYRWLQKNSYPEGYQTLCMNCQFIKRWLEKENR